MGGCSRVNIMDGWVGGGGGVGSQLNIKGGWVPG